MGDPRNGTATLGRILGWIGSDAEESGPADVDAALACHFDHRQKIEDGSRHDVVESWAQTGQTCAAVSLGLDYLFLVAYAAAGVLRSSDVAGRLGSLHIPPGEALGMLL